MPRLFKLIRKVDETGISGEGHVLDGVVWPCGKVACCWRSEGNGQFQHDSMDHFLQYHVNGHSEGTNEVVWLDEEPESTPDVPVVQMKDVRLLDRATLDAVDRNVGDGRTQKSGLVIELCDLLLALMGKHGNRIPGELLSARIQDVPADTLGKWLLPIDLQEVTRIRAAWMGRQINGDALPIADRGANLYRILDAIRLIRGHKVADRERLFQQCDACDSVAGHGGQGPEPCILCGSGG